MDFTLKSYTSLLKKLKGIDYSFLTLKDYLDNSKVKIQNEKLNLSTNKLPPTTYDQRICLLRHDVDRMPDNSLATAKIENALGIQGSYYFRIVPESFDKEIIQQIAGLGHEIGYHYEEMDSPLLISPKVGEKSLEMRIDSAYELFKINLEKMREVADIKTICMHGSPLSKYDNKLLWSKYNYRDHGIIGEPYLDMDWNEFGYLTDTGRRWDGESVSVRDKVKSRQQAIGSRKTEDKSQKLNVKSEKLEEGNSLSQSSIKNQESRVKNLESNILHPTPAIRQIFRSTFDIIDKIDELPDKVMITVHPQRWNDGLILWTKELVLQNIKNSVKKFLVKAQSNL